MTGKYDRAHFDVLNPTRAPQSNYRGPHLQGLEAFGWFRTTNSDSRPRQRVALAKSFRGPRRDH